MIKDKISKSIDSREHIILIAMQLFAKRGYHKTTTNAICKKAGISTGLLFYHFGSKEKLLKSIIEMILSKIEGTFNYDEHENPEKVLESIIDAFFSSIKQNREYWDLYIALLYQPDTKKHILDDIIAHSTKFRRTVYDLMKKMGREDPGGDSFEFEIFRTGAFAAYLSNHNDKVLDHAKQKMKTKYLSNQFK